MILEIDHILGIKVKRTKKKIRISQRAYVKRMLEKFSIANCKSRLIPLIVGTSLLTNDLPINEKEVSEIKNIPYYETLELLM